MTAPECAFDRHGDDPPTSPIVLSVPHAGRDYPLALRAALRVPLAAATVLEDRYIDAVALAAHRDETLFVQRRARAWIDLNRSEQERDPAIDEGAAWTALPLASAKLRGGLGLVPRRVAGAGELWRRRLDAQDVAARIRDDHRPYHAALALALAAARARFGTAVLLDIHSMPSLGPDQPRLVIGDRFGRSAGTRFIAAIEAVAARHGVMAALNTPYAGGHILDTHARPASGVHAIQIEFDRSLYLDPAGDRPGDTLPAVARLLRDMIDALADEAATTLSIAAE
ncbi:MULTISPECIES: N-formylglutamate amidohydrolase [Sphingomonas]|jgi:N-formylglutamate amidohydrolase|uniref:N-formylglutamate amidohydrolase n=1 Tax=Sphingomonas echinoides TaxID=59803 RepID=A0ABU4PIT9_9SPHN|nr:N-formylglutamate amidohydrolase [Sphingomonas echinoides]MDX5983941.1 N-formylglutamate amidohydrolase [Sphingomonas echinoides]